MTTAEEMDSRHQEEAEAFASDALADVEGFVEDTVDAIKDDL